MQTSINSSEMHFLSEQFVNEQVKHLLGEKSPNPVKRSSYKNFVPIIPFKIFYFLFKRRYYRNKCLDFFVSEIYVLSTHSYT